MSSGEAGRERVIVTGVCGNLGRAVARRLHRGAQVIGIDWRSFADLPSDVERHEIDIRRRKSRDIFRRSRASAVVHLQISRSLRRPAGETHSWNLEVFSSIMEYVAAYDIPKLVLLSTAEVYGPHPDNPQFIPEDYPLYGADNFPQIRDIVEMDMLAQSFFWRAPACSLVILRPVHVVGYVGNQAMRWLGMREPPVAAGFDPMVQLAHERDVVAAIEAALDPAVKGVFNVASDGEMPMSGILRALHRRPVRVPSILLSGVSALGYGVAATQIPPGMVDYLKYPCMVDTERARRVMGLRPRHDIKDCIEHVRECSAW